MIGLEDRQALSRDIVRIPVNVTADSGNVTDVPANVTGGSVLRTLILCRLAFSAGFPLLVFGLF